MPAHSPLALHSSGIKLAIMPEVSTTPAKAVSHAIVLWNPVLTRYFVHRRSSSYSHLAQLRVENRHS